MFIDTHCHLQFSDFDTDRAMVIGNAKKAGVKKFIVPGIDAQSTQKAIELSQQNQNVVFASAGIHPYEAQADQDIAVLQPFTSKIIAIGECGLDYHLYKGERAISKKDNQKRLFDEHIHLANRLDMPLIIHCRDAFEDVFSVLDNASRMPKGVIHCFSGGLQELRMAVERNLYIGIDGNVTYIKQIERLMPHIPTDRLILETDSPYLTPVPFRGSRNEPKHLPGFAKRISELTNKQIIEIETATTINAERLFKLSY